MLEITRGRQMIFGSPPVFQLEPSGRLAELHGNFAEGCVGSVFVTLLPRIESAEYYVLRLTLGGGPHRNQFLR